MLFACQMLQPLRAAIPVTASVTASPTALKGSRRARMASLQTCAQTPLHTHSCRCHSAPGTMGMPPQARLFDTWPHCVRFSDESITISVISTPILTIKASFFRISQAPPEKKAQTLQLTVFRYQWSCGDYAVYAMRCDAFKILEGAQNVCTKFRKFCEHVQLIGIV